MQLKKIALVFLVVVMMFSLAAVFTAAEEASTDFSLSAKLESEDALSTDPFGVKPGAIIELVISVDSNPGKLSDLEIFVEFDNEALEVQNVTADNYGDIFNKNHSVALTTPKQQEGKIQVWVQANSGYETDLTGEFVTLKFKVKDGYDGNVKKLEIYKATYRIDKDNGTFSVPALPTIKAHNYGAPVYVDGNCVNDSINRYTCTEAGCGDVLEVVVKEKGHTVGDLIPEVAPTTENTGIRAHYECSVCSKCLDLDKWTEIDPVIPKLPKMISTPEDSVWTKGDKHSLEYVSDAKFDDFKSIKLNGKVVEQGAYVVKADEDGNTVVVLEPAFLKTLAVGDYELSIVSENGSCSADFTVRSNGAIVTVVIIVVAILVIVAGVIAALKVLKKKNII